MTHQLTLFERASERLEAALAEYDGCPQHSDIVLTVDGVCAYCEMDAALMRAAIRDIRAASHDRAAAMNKGWLHRTLATLLTAKEIA